MNEQKLKPCPFCGNQAYPYLNYKIHSEKTRCLIKCTRCNAMMEYRDEKSAVEAWNRRADEAEIERLEEEIECYKAELESEHLSRMDNIRELQMELSKTKTEAIKEFAERLKEKAYTNNYCQEIVLKDEIDNLVKEMKEK